MKEKFNLTIELEGEIDDNNVNMIFIHNYENLKNVNIIFDCTKLTDICSKGIAYISDIISEIEANGNKHAIVGCNEHIKDLFELVGIFTISDFFDTKEEAIEFFNKN